MRVKRFTGSTIQETIARVREEFGADAVILDTKTRGRRGLWRLLGRRQVDVVAAVGVEAEAAPAGGCDDDLVFRPPRGLVRDTTSSGPVPTATGPARPRQPGSRPSVTKELEPPEQADIRPIQLVWQMYQKVVRAGRADEEGAAVPPGEKVGGEGHTGQTLPGDLLAIEERLIASEMEEHLAKAIVQSVAHDLDGGKTSLQELENLVAHRMVAVLRCVPPWQFPADTPQIVALIGPTGVGKTTTLAKIAANYSVIAGADVGVITVDTYRIGAIDQLRTYADIMGIPLAVAETGQSIKEIVGRWSHKDLILIDTAGMSPRDTERFRDIEEILAPVAAVEKHLVFSATTRHRDLVEIVRRFDQLGFERLIATKLDETTSYGILLTAYALVRRPYSFLADGQAVPECIQAADAKEMVRLILGDR